MISRVLPLALLALAGSAQAAGLTVDDMVAMQRISDPQVSPDAKWVTFTVSDVDLAANRRRTDVWVAAVDGSGARRLTSSPAQDDSAVWSPDGKWIYFSSTRSGSAQVWRLPFGTGGEAEQVTKLPLDVNGFRLFPDGKRLVVALEVWPEAKTLADSVKRDEAEAQNKVKARAYEQLLFRHWDTWEDGRYSHLFVWTPPELGGKADDARDVTPGQTTDSPTHPFGGMEEVSISPDGLWIAFVARVGGRQIAWTTNTDVFLVDASGRGAPTALTAANKAYDYSPTFSPDGKQIAVLAMARPGFEADRQRITLYDVASRKPRVVTEAWDRSPGSITFSADGKTIYTTADDLGHASLFAVDVASGKATALVNKGTSAAPQIAGERIVFAKDTLRQPVELFTVKRDGSDLEQITHLNDARVAKITWGEAEQFTFKGAKGDTVYAWLVKPAGWKPGGKRVPLVALIHGGPQGSFGDHFHYRWNPQAFAGRGFAALMIDFHGSTGYGQAFTDAIRGDWGGAPYEDVMLGVDAALAKYPFLDANRLAAAGASYGGFLVNWIAGKTDRFKALVSHDGNLDERFAYFATEELWFPEWEHGGTPWDNPEGYAKHNPLDLVKNWKTPMLVIHGGLDFRIVDVEGMATFTALQRKGIPSRFLHFPDENHWVLRPLNSKRWHDEVLGWIERWTAAKR
jgi:dipeptidyl aminopeptidase/acylaminoacyl peptidase